MKEFFTWIFFGLIVDIAKVITAIVFVFLFYGALGIGVFYLLNFLVSNRSFVEGIFNIITG